MKSIHSYLLEPPFALPIAGMDRWRLVRPFSEFFKRIGIHDAGTEFAQFALLNQEPETGNWTLIDIAHPVFDFSVFPSAVVFIDDPLPSFWMLWVIERLYGVEPFSLTDHELNEDIPVALPAGTWAHLEQIERDAELEPLKAAFLTKDAVSGQYDIKTMEPLRRAIEERLLAPLGAQKTVIQDVHLERSMTSFAIVGSWSFKQRSLGKYLQLDVYRRRNPDDSISVAFEIEQVSSKSPNKKLGEGSTLLEAMKTSGLWIEEGEKQAWKKRHIAQPTWLIDRSIIEPYRLLGVPSPLVLPRVDLLEWLTEAST